jgi:hypothetical protein
LKISQKGWSERVEKQVVKLAVRGSYGEAVKTYRELVGLSLVKTTGWERTQERGRQLRQRRLAEAEKRWALPKRQELLPGEALEAVHKAVSLDGVLVYILGEGWKEVKVGCVFEYATHQVYDRRRGETQEVVKGTAPSYTAYLGGPDVLASCSRPRPNGAVFTRLKGARVSRMERNGSGISSACASRLSKRLWIGIMPPGTCGPPRMGRHLTRQTMG